MVAQSNSSLFGFKVWVPQRSARGGAAFWHEVGEQGWGKLPPPGLEPGSLGRVRAEYPNQLDYSGFWEMAEALGVMMLPCSCVSAIFHFCGVGGAGLFQRRWPPPPLPLPLL